MTLTMPTLVTICNHKTNASGTNPCTKCDDSIFSHSREILGGVNFYNGHVTRATPISGMVSHLSRLKANI